MRTSAYLQCMSQPKIQFLDRLAEHSGTTAGFRVS